MTARCPLCRYPRAGLEDENAPCPECGRRPGDTRPPLAEEPAEHRRRLARGARLAQIACFVRLAQLATLGAIAFAAPDAAWWVLLTGSGVVASMNALSAFRLTAPGRVPIRAWSRPTLRGLTLLDLALVAAGGLALAATRDTPNAGLALAIAIPAALVATWFARSLAWIAVVRSLAPRLADDRLERRLNAWFTYAGVAAMTSVAGFVAAGLTALVPILAPITVVLAAPYGLVMLVLGAIALVGALNLHGLLARELADAAATTAGDQPAGTPRP